ncbi:hypothetical protein ACGFYV_14700 [Streptomyces sp. NPDC048297]
MGSLDHGNLSPALLTSRRHIDFGRTSSDICRPLRGLRSTCRPA